MRSWTLEPGDKELTKLEFPRIESSYVRGVCALETYTGVWIACEWTLDCGHRPPVSRNMWLFLSVSCAFIYLPHESRAAKLPLQSSLFICVYFRELKSWFHEGTSVSWASIILMGVTMLPVRSHHPNPHCLNEKHTHEVDFSMHEFLVFSLYYSCAGFLSLHNRMAYYNSTEARC